MEVDIMKPSLDKLNSYIAYYVHRVIGLNVILNDSPQACAITTEKPIIELPMTQESLATFLGADFVEKAPVELLFSIVIGLTYHEAAHLMSGEQHVEPHILDNIINDSNDFTFVPERWKGSMPFTISLMNTSFKQGMDLAQIPLVSREDRLQALIHLTVSYMRKLRILNNGKELRSLTDKHELEPYFEKIKPIMRKARKTKISDRPQLVKQLYDVLKDFWDNSQSQRSTASTFEEALENSKQIIAIELSGNDAKALGQILSRSGIMQKAKGELTKTANAVVIIEKQQEAKQEAESLKRIKELGSLTTTIQEEELNQHTEPVNVNTELARKLKTALKPLLFERSLARKKASIVGSAFAPSRFHEIKTQPDNPQIRKDIKRTGKNRVETEIILCFDRSGSMRGEKETVCKDVAGTFYTAIESIPQAKIQIMGFDTEVTLIKGKKKNPQILKRIASGLSARGGTDYPLALYHTLKTMEKSQAHKKIIIMLTDGDINGSIQIEDLTRYAKHINTSILTIGIKGSDETTLKETLGTKNVIYIEDINQLPETLKKKAQSVM